MAKQLIREKVAMCDAAVQSGDLHGYKKNRIELLEEGRLLRGHAPIGAREVELAAARLAKRAAEANLAPGAETTTPARTEPPSGDVPSIKLDAGDIPTSDLPARSVIRRPGS